MLQQELTNIVDTANNLKIEKQKIEYEIKNLEKEINLIDKWFKDDKCPTCGKRNTFLIFRKLKVEIIKNKKL